MERSRFGMGESMSQIEFHIPSNLYPTARVEANDQLDIDYRLFLGKPQAGNGA